MSNKPFNENTEKRNALARELNKIAQGVDRLKFHAFHYDWVTISAVLELIEIAIKDLTKPCHKLDIKPEEGEVSKCCGAKARYRAVTKQQYGNPNTPYCGKCGERFSPVSKEECPHDDSWKTGGKCILCPKAPVSKDKEPYFEGEITTRPVKIVGEQLNPEEIVKRIKEPKNELEKCLPKIPGAKPRQEGEVDKIMKPLEDFIASKGEDKCEHTGTPKDIVGCKICNPETLEDKLNPPTPSTPPKADWEEPSLEYLVNDLVNSIQGSTLEWQKSAILKFLHQKLEEAYERGRKEGYTDGCSNPNYNDGYEQGRKDTLAEIEELVNKNWQNGDDLLKNLALLKEKKQ